MLSVHSNRWSFVAAAVSISASYCPYKGKLLGEKQPCVIVVSPKEKSGKMKIKTPYFCCFSPRTNPELMLNASTTPEFYVLRCRNGIIFKYISYTAVQYSSK